MITKEEFERKSEKELKTWTWSKKYNILKKFFENNPDKVFHFREICRLARLSRGGSTHQYLQKLVVEGFVKKKGYYYIKA